MTHAATRIVSELYAIVILSVCPLSVRHTRAICQTFLTHASLLF